MPEIQLPGCMTEPLGSYLKALGVLRLVAEQADPSAAGWWAGDTFMLRSRFDLEELEQFFLYDYVPTPMVAPWNGGSGFGPKDQQSGIAAIEASNASRLAAYRDAIAAGRQLVAMPEWDQLDKADQVRLCRAALPDETVRWIDAVVVLTSDGREFPPLLGTGGNVGRLEFSNNFMQRLVDVLEAADGARPGGSSRSWLHDALEGSTIAARVKAAVGQLDPTATGGANSDPLDPAGVSLVNPWDFVLSFEGSLLFASGAARRMGSTATGRAAMPFMVDTSPIGYGTSADAETARGELWAPLWRRPASFREVDRLLAEGRGEWKRRQARSGLDFACAVATLGVDRGIDTFVRHAFVERHGQNMLAVAVARVSTTEHRRSDVALLEKLDSWLAQVDGWLEGLRRLSSAPASIRSAVRRVQRAEWDLAVQQAPGLRARALQDVLVAAAALDAALSRSRNAQTKVSPCPWLPAAAWVPHLDDRSVEFQLALAFASQRDKPTRRDGQVHSAEGSGFATAKPALLLRPVRESNRGDGLRWSGNPPLVAGLGWRRTAEVLSELLARRCVEVLGRRSDDSNSPNGGLAGVDVAFDLRASVPLEAVVAYLECRVDDARLEALIHACLLLDYSRPFEFPAPGGRLTTVAPPAYALLAPFFHCRQLEIGGHSVTLRPGAEWVPRLKSGHPGQRASILSDAIRRLRVAQLVPLVGRPDVVGSSLVDPQRLLAALAFPISGWAATELLRRVASTRHDLVTR